MSNQSIHSSAGLNYLSLKIDVEHGNKDQLELYSQRAVMKIYVLFRTIKCKKDERKSKNNRRMLFS